MAGNDDWRRCGQEAYLLGARLVRRPWEEPRPGWDHDHCAFCWEKFSKVGDAEALREGYATLDGKHWVCDQCYQDFKAEFKWKKDTGAN